MWIRLWTVGFYKRQGLYCPDYWLPLAAHKGVGSMEIVTDILDTLKIYCYTKRHKPHWNFEYVSPSTEGWILLLHSHHAFLYHIKNFVKERLQIWEDLLLYRRPKTCHYVGPVLLPLHKFSPLSCWHYLRSTIINCKYEATCRGLMFVPIVMKMYEMV
jgi:hypothetical protein